MKNKNSNTIHDTSNTIDVSANTNTSIYLLHIKNSNSSRYRLHQGKVEFVLIKGFKGTTTIQEKSRPHLLF